MTPEEARLSAAREYAERMHAGQTRIGGAPYITHPQAVAEIVRCWGYGTEYQIAALFHDLLEDTDATEAKIAELGGPDVLEAVRLLTKQPGYQMPTYVQGIRDNPIAFVVKGADRLHNLRCAPAAGPDFRRRYVRESEDWYMDFAAEIPEAIRNLASTLEAEDAPAGTA